MSGWTGCVCEGTRKEKMKNWYVPKGYRNINYSYFEYPKGKAHISNYSTVMCKECNMHIRSNSKYVNGLPDGDDQEIK